MVLGNGRWGMEGVIDAGDDGLTEASDFCC